MPISLKLLKNLIYLFLTAILLSGCALLGSPPPVKKDVSLYQVPSAQYPEFSDDMAYDSLEHAITQSISYFRRLPYSKEFKFGNDTYDASHMILSLELFLNFIRTKPKNLELKQFIESNYRVYKSVGSNESCQVLFTGYYEPILQGSLQKNDTYRFPIYPWPSDLSVIDLSLFSPKYKGNKIIGRYKNPEFVPYYDREAIEFEGLPGNTSQPLAWVNDKVDLFFLQIQGSGKIFLDNSQIINVHYHISNGRPYRSIGNYLINKDKISLSEMSMQKIREYLNQHPEEIDTILNYNQSYVFFKLEEDGPYGSLEVKLTPGRSIALDREIFPLAGLAFIETKIPLIDGDSNIHKWIELSRFALNQDTGGAIQGPGRADLFWGNGSYAQIAAGHMKYSGNLYFLVLKPDR
ncbi:MAG: MltA domain-containing protein [Desulfobacterales bacterium]|nr:MltA domain-containing protein [Desulfobacterales bacterium]